MRNRWHRGAPERASASTTEKTSRASQARFALTFALAAAVLFSLYAFPYRDASLSEAWFDSYLRGYARLAGATLSWFDDAVNVTGNVINGRYSLRIVKTCDAMEANLLYLAAVFAFPTRWYLKVAAAALGLGILVAVNVLRICSLYFIGLRWPAQFDFFHTELWPLMLIVVTAALFAIWASWITRLRPADPAPPHGLV